MFMLILFPFQLSPTLGGWGRRRGKLKPPTVLSAAPEAIHGVNVKKAAMAGLASAPGDVGLGNDTRPTLLHRWTNAEGQSVAEPPLHHGPVGGGAGLCEKAGVACLPNPPWHRQKKNSFSP